MDIMELSSVSEGILDRAFIKFSSAGGTPQVFTQTIMKQAREDSASGKIAFVPEIEYLELEENGNVYGYLVFRHAGAVYAAAPFVKNDKVIGRNSYDVGAFGYYRARELMKFLLDNKEKATGGEWAEEEFTAALKEYYRRRGTGMEVVSGQDPNNQAEGWICIRKAAQKKYTSENCYMRKLFSGGRVRKIVFAGDQFSPVAIAL